MRHFVDDNLFHAHEIDAVKATADRHVERCFVARILDFLDLLAILRLVCQISNIYTTR